MKTETSQTLQKVGDGVNGEPAGEGRGLRGLKLARRGDTRRA